jgi:hypothetical protein
MRRSGSTVARHPRRSRPHLSACRRLRLESLEDRFLLNAAPTDILLSADSVREQEPAGTAFGIFSTVDPDAGDTFSYSLVAGDGDVDNASFTIDTMGLLHTAASLAHSTYSIRVQSTDQVGAYFEKQFSVEVIPLAGLKVDLVSTALDSSVWSFTGNEGSDFACMSGDGRYVAFFSWSSNLVPGDSNVFRDVFRKDLLSGETLLVSVGAQGLGNYDSRYPSLSYDGRYVAFETSASNLVTGDTNGALDIIVKDMVSGLVTRASVDREGGQGNGSSTTPSISADGRTVAFRSTATNLIVGWTDGNGATEDIFVKDLDTGIVQLASVTSSRVQGNGASSRPDISSDGRYVAFQSDATDLFSEDGNGSTDVFLKDLQTGVLSLVSSVNGSLAVEGNSGGSYFPGVSDDGRYVAFHSNSTNLITGDTNSRGDVFVKDLTSSAVILVSCDSDSVLGNNWSYDVPSLSGDGRYVAFRSVATNLVADDTNGQDDIFVKDLQTQITTRVSIRSDTVQGNALSMSPRISDDGLRVAFTSYASNLVPGDTNARSDILVKDLSTGEILLASNRNVAGESSRGGCLDSNQTSVSADGRYVAFESFASDLVTGDTNGLWDIFVKDTLSGVVTRASVNSAGVEGNSSSYSPSISGDGRTVAFRSSATNMIVGSTDGNGTVQDIFVKSLDTGIVQLASATGAGVQATGGGSSNPDISSDGRYVGFQSDATNLFTGDENGSTDVFLKDLRTGTLKLVSSVNGSLVDEGNSGGSYFPSVSDDGRYVAFHSNSTNLITGDTNNVGDMFVKDLTSMAVILVSCNGDLVLGNGTSNDFPSMSGDGRYVAFRSVATNLVAGDTNGRDDIFVKDLQSKIVTRVSVSSDKVQGNALSMSPRISNDGRYVAFASDASNLADGDSNGYQDIFLNDAVSGATVRMSASSECVPGDRASSGPSISSNGLYVVFYSSAGTLHPWDANHLSDVFRVATPTPPTDLAILGTTVGENLPAGTVVGVFSATREFTSTSLTFALVPGEGSTDNTLFTTDVAGNLRTAVMFDYETRKTTGYSIRVRVRDQLGLWYEEVVAPITITDAHDAPEGTDATRTILEDATFTFAVPDFGFADPFESTPDQFRSVLVTTLPALGTLRLDGAAVAAGQSIDVAAIEAGRFTYTPALNASASPYTSFTFQVRDDAAETPGNVSLDPTPNTFLWSVTPVSDPPTGTDSTKTGREDTACFFRWTDFGFNDGSDRPWNGPAGVLISSLPVTGTLNLGNDAVSVAQYILYNDILLNQLRYIPPTDAAGNAYASFTFQVRDDGGTADGGADLDPTPNTLTINLAPVGDAPQGTDGTITAFEDQAYSLEAADFGLTDPKDNPPNALYRVLIASLPGAGSLRLNGTAVTAGQYINVADINLHLFTFTAASNASGDAYANFTFQVQDNGGGEDLDPIANTLTINVTAVNDPPVVDALAAHPDPAFVGDPVTLTATGVADPADLGGSVVRVDFYRESNGIAGLQTSGDALVGSDGDGGDGWSVSLATGSLAPARYTYYAQAVDDQGAASAEDTAPAAASTLNPVWNYDVDGNGLSDALTDGILILRYLFAPGGAWTFADAVGTGATRTTREEIRSFLDDARSTMLDVDGNGTPDALTDGILILRYLFAPTGAWTFGDAVGTGAARNDRESLRAFMNPYHVPSIATAASLQSATSETTDTALPIMATADTSTVLASADSPSREPSTVDLPFAESPLSDPTPALQPPAQASAGFAWQVDESAAGPLGVVERMEQRAEASAVDAVIVQWTADSRVLSPVDGRAYGWTRHSLPADSEADASSDEVAEVECLLLPLGDRLAPR